MLSFLIVFLSVGFLGIVLMLRFVLKAPQGYQDREGFHYGEEPSQAVSSETHSCKTGIRSPIGRVAARQSYSSNRPVLRER